MLTSPAALSSLSSETVTSIIKVMMELNHCTTGRALVVIANTTTVTLSYESLPRVSALNQDLSTGSSPTKIHLRCGSKTKTPLWLLSLHLLLSLYRSSRCRGLQRAGWVWA